MGPSKNQPPFFMARPWAWDTGYPPEVFTGNAPEKLPTRSLRKGSRKSSSIGHHFFRGKLRGCTSEPTIDVQQTCVRFPKKKVGLVSRCPPSFSSPCWTSFPANGASDSVTRTLHPSTAAVDNQQPTTNNQTQPQPQPSWYLFCSRSVVDHQQGTNQQGVGARLPCGTCHSINFWPSKVFSPPTSCSIFRNQKEPWKIPFHWLVYENASKGLCICHNPYIPGESKNPFISWNNQSDIFSAQFAQAI